MTGRRVHDGLLRLLTSAALRRALAARDAHAGDLAPGLGAEAAAVLRGADPERLARLARFMGRHFYRERIVRLFAASRRLARPRGGDVLDLLHTPAFDALLDTAEVGAGATAERVAALVEARLGAPLGELPYGPDLLAYEGLLFRVEAGPRRWRDGGPAGPRPVRSAHARVCLLEWDVTGLVAAVRRGDAELPAPARRATRLLLTLAPNGRVTTVRCPEPVERLLALLDGARSASEAAGAAGLGTAEAERVLRQLTDVGAVEWPAVRV